MALLATRSWSLARHVTGRSRRYLHRCRQVLDHYSTLGVASTASTEEIKKRYFELARTLHPDISKAPEAVEKFRAIAEAYRVLSNAHLRSVYNHQRHSPQAQAAGPMSSYTAYSTRQQRREGASEHRIHALFDLFTHPLLLVALFAIGTGFLFLVPKEDRAVEIVKKELRESDLVDAWFNRRSGRWEQPAPWDPNFDEGSVQRVSRKLVHESLPNLDEDEED